MERTFSGTYAILLIAGVGIAGAVGSQWYYHHLQQRPLALWGTGAAKLMVAAPIVEAWHLVPQEKAPAALKSAQELPERISVGGQHWILIEQVGDVSDKPSFMNLRRSLINDTSFDWSASEVNCKPEGTYALLFSNGEPSAPRVAAPNCPGPSLLEPGAGASIEPIIGPVRQFFGEKFPPPVT